MAQKVVYAVNGVRGLVLWDSFLFPYEFLLPHMKKAILGIGWVLRYHALGRGRTVQVATTSSSQLRWHSGWSLALGRRCRSALKLETNPLAASLLTLGLLPWYLGKYHDPRAELSDHGSTSRSAGWYLRT